MRHHLALASALVLLAATASRSARAQHGAAPTTVRPPAEAAQYDFLVGQWELTVTPKVSGLAARIHGVPRLRGTWKAWRALDGWGIEDEIRIVDESGNPQSLSHALRVYQPATRRWAVAAVDGYRQQVSQSSAQWTGREMVSLATSVDGDGHAHVTRTRVTDISATRFRFQQDRSDDDGRTWDEGRLVIEARRVREGAGR